MYPPAPLNHTKIFMGLPLRFASWELVPEWRRPIGCLKLQVIFHKRATNYRAFLWKMTYKDEASYDCMPPCT